MSIDRERKRLCTPLGVRCLAPALPRFSLLWIDRHRTPAGVREPLFVSGAINIALLPECRSLFSSASYKHCTPAGVQESLFVGGL